MAWRGLLLLLDVLGVSIGFQLRFPPALQPKLRFAPQGVNASKSWPVSRATSSTMDKEATPPPPVEAQEGSIQEEEAFDWAKQVSAKHEVLLSQQLYISVYT